jgi:NAD(P)-dependent dehydrogenase (short-subunit alcohol dehydrogenase family)
MNVLSTVLASFVDARHPFSHTSSLAPRHKGRNQPLLLIMPVMTALVTGANKGIGYFIAEGLLQKGFSVILACRNLDLADVAATRLKAGAPDGAQVATVQLDLSHLATLAPACDASRAIVQCWRPETPFLDLLVNNAGFAFKYAATEPFGHQARITNDVNF